MVLVRDIPEDTIFLDILTRLPVNSLLRFRSVCKSWRSLIDSDIFIRLHLSRAINRKPHLFYSDTVDMYCLAEGKVVRKPLMDANLISAQVRASLHGLLCVETESSDGEGGSRWNYHVVNPATHGIFHLPGSSPVSVSICQIVFDPFSKRGAHKVLIVSHEGSVVDAKIFTLGVDRSWRQLEGAVHSAHCCSFSLALPCVNGALHWMTVLFKNVDESSEWTLLPVDFVVHRYRGSESIVAFDIRDERFRTLMYPNCCPQGDFCGGMHDTYLVEIGGCLYLLHFDVSNSIMDVWALKDYPKGQWIREYRIDSNLLQRELHLEDDYPCFRLDVLAAFEGEIFMMVSASFRDQTSTLASYRPAIRKFINIGYQIPEILTFEGTYVESLLSCKILEQPKLECMPSGSENV